MKIITFDQVKNLNVSPEVCYEWASSMILHKKDAVLPAKVHISMPGNSFCNVMPSLVGKWGGVKIVTRYPERQPSLDSKILLFDLESGSFKALIDGNWITAMRTGAVAAHSIMYFGKPGFTTVGMIGLGNMARSSLLVLASIIQDRKLTIKLFKYKDQAELFVKRFKSYNNLSFSIVDSVADTIKGSDIVISCATYFEADIASDECFDEGVLVVPIHTRGFTNCDLFFDKVYADDTKHVDHFKNFEKFKYYAEVSDVVNGVKDGRTNNRERILAYNIGISIHDVFFASKIFEMMRHDPAKYNSLPDVVMNDPIEQFWI